jgi:hypothetical protein
MRDAINGAARPFASRYVRAVERGLAAQIRVPPPAACRILRP